MSWLNPNKITPSDYDAQQRVEAVVGKYGKLSGEILNAFNESDPLRVFFGENVDEYVGYVQRFLTQLGDRDFSKLSDQEISVLVRGSFHASQIEQGFAAAEDIDTLIDKIASLRD